jgi:sphingolipid delta-4 desaturase
MLLSRSVRGGENVATDDQALQLKTIFKFHPRQIGSSAPVFPGYEVDILARVPDSDREDAVWHRERAKAIVKAHPEVKQLFGNDPTTAFWCLAAAGSQIGLALVASRLPWWGMLLLAWGVGSVINVMLFQLGHECVHNLVFKRQSWNRYLFTVTTLPMFLSGHHTWWAEHLVHHTDMGARKDFITRRRTLFLMTRRASPLFFPFVLWMLVLQMLRSIVGLVMWIGGILFRFRLKPGPWTLSVLADEHLVSGYKKERAELWAALYPLLNLAVCGALFAYGGWRSVAYLLASQAFFTGFAHPYCLGWVLGISHFHGSRRYQPTASHYGWLVNMLSFNAGLHVEHHDLSQVPWRRMWQLRQLAPEFYEDLIPIRSYTLLALQFVFSGEESFEQNFNQEAHRHARRMALKGAAAADEASAGVAG